MKEKLAFVELLHKDLMKNAKIYATNKEKSKGAGYYYSDNYANKNYGKVALKRKITYLRQELLNLERIIDNG